MCRSPKAKRCGFSRHPPRPSPKGGRAAGTLPGGIARWRAGSALGVGRCLVSPLLCSLVRAARLRARARRCCRSRPPVSRKLMDCSAIDPLACIQWMWNTSAGGSRQSTPLVLMLQGCLLFWR